MAGEKTVRVKGSVPIEFFKEGKMFVIYCPVLDLSTCGETFEEAQSNFADAYKLFLTECLERGTLAKVLKSLGWAVELKNSVYKVAPPHYLGVRQIELDELVST